jgi:hypothetical protein
MKTRFDVFSFLAVALFWVWYYAFSGAKYAPNASMTQVRPLDWPFGVQRSPAVDSQAPSSEEPKGSADSPSSDTRSERDAQANKEFQMAMAILEKPETMLTLSDALDHLRVAQRLGHPQAEGWCQKAKARFDELSEEHDRRWDPEFRREEMRRYFQQENRRNGAIQMRYGDWRNGQGKGF